MSTNKSIARSAGIIGLATTLSRVLGLLRDMVIANFFGTAVYAQAFVVAFRIPNLLRDLIGEGAANAAFVPVFSEELAKNGKKDFFKLAQVIFNIMLIVLLALTAIGILASPVIVRLIAPGFLGDPEKFRITVALTRWLFPFLILVGLWAYAMGALNTLNHFTAPALGPCVLNVAMILCATWFGEDIFGLTTGVLLGGLTQLLIQFPPLYLRGWRPRLTGDFSHPKARRIGVLLIPRALGSCVYQVNVFISTIMASFSGLAGEGAVAALYFANRLWQLPLAVFGIALAQAALPNMSRQAALGEIKDLKATILFLMRALLFILVPSSVGLMVLSAPITRLIFQHGKFNVHSTEMTASALLFYALGLTACGGIKILTNAFYSLQDTKTPLKAGLISLAINIALNILLIFPLRADGLALATSLAAIFNCIFLYIFLRKRIGALGLRMIYGSIFKILAAGAIMGFLCYYACLKLNVMIAIAAGVAGYFLVCFLLGSRELKELSSWMLKRR